MNCNRRRRWLFAGIDRNRIERDVEKAYNNDNTKTIYQTGLRNG